MQKISLNITHGVVLMSTYKTKQRSNATFEQTNWPQNNTTEKTVSFTETPFDYEVSTIDSQTSTQELTQEAIEHASEKTNVNFIMQTGDTICAYRQVTLSQ